MSEISVHSISKGVCRWGGESYDEDTRGWSGYFYCRVRRHWKFWVRSEANSRKNCGGGGSSKINVLLKVMRSAKGGRKGIEYLLQARNKAGNAF